MLFLDLPLPMSELYRFIVPFTVVVLPKDCPLSVFINTGSKSE